MKLFIDTANIEEIKTAHEMGIISGVTTNPSIIAKENKRFEDAVKEILETAKDCFIFAEAISLDAAGMIEEGRALHALSDRMVVKIPMCAEGLKACSLLSKEGVHVCMTLLFSETQAVLAAAAGACYVAPFVGRVDDIGWDGLELVQGVRDIFDAQGQNVQIVAASTRNPVHIAKLAKMGCDIATVPYKVLMSLVDHPLTKQGLDKFLKDWENVPK